MAREQSSEVEKPVRWIGSAKSDLLDLPGPVISEMGYVPWAECVRVGAEVSVKFR